MVKNYLASPQTILGVPWQPNRHWGWRESLQMRFHTFDTPPSAACWLSVTNTPQARCSSLENGERARERKRGKMWLASGDFFFLYPSQAVTHYEPSLEGKEFCRDGWAMTVKFLAEAAWKLPAASSSETLPLLLVSLYISSLQVSALFIYLSFLFDSFLFQLLASHRYLLHLCSFELRIAFCQPLCY